MHQRGFTLIELMIVVTVLAIVSMIAASSFRKHTLKSNRQNGSECLVEVQKQMENYYSRFNAYPASLIDIGYAAGNCPVSEGKSTLYKVSISKQPTSADPTYALQASGTGEQASDGTLLLSVDARDTAAAAAAYHKQHTTPAGVTEDGWTFQPGQ